MELIPEEYRSCLFMQQIIILIAQTNMFHKYNIYISICLIK